MTARASGNELPGRARALVLGVVACLAVSAVIWAAGAGGQEPHLVVTTRAGDVLVDVPLPEDSTWTIEWLHSVAGVKVFDRFAYVDGVMYVTDQVTPHLDIAGLGGFAGRGTMTQLPDGRYHLSDIDLPLHGNVHNVIIGTERAPTVLVVAGRRFELSHEHAGQHARIEVVLR